MSVQIILAIETSCDETSAAVLVDGDLRSNVISSQIDIHRRFGGVVPEVASRNHTLSILPVIDQALSEAKINKNQLTHIAVTYGAGLVGALLVGVSTAKALSYALGIPLIRVNHIEAHIAANYIEHTDLEPPFLAVVASGGHTSLILASGYNEFKLVGSTRDDAIGEAFDKVARVLGLPYPGGPQIDKLSRGGSACIELVKAKKQSPDCFDLSYSGLKTAVVNYVNTLNQKGQQIPVADICASFTKAAADMLINAAVSAAKTFKLSALTLSGGVAANSYLRENISLKGVEAGLKVFYPSPILCTDNAAMVAVRARHSITEGKNIADLTLNAQSSLRVGN